ncbi:MAG: N-acetyltransferase [Burkholderiales bacterium]|nr:N-acetyltransferase [Burkholderiales bacterium]
MSRFQLRCVQDLASLPDAWDDLLARQDAPTPFMRRDFLQQLQASGSAVAESGWQACFVLLEAGDRLCAAAPLWIKAHSWGEYVFDQAWARAYAQHGLRYYPKGVLAVPFTPVPGSRLLAEDDLARATLVRQLPLLASELGLSGLHLLFGSAADAAAMPANEWARREQPQFHWQRQPAWSSFEDFLASLRADKRKKILQERRQVRESGAQMRVQRGHEIGAADWAFWARCYAATYAVRGQTPYLADDFFAACGVEWLLFSAELDGERVAASLCAWDAERGVLYGRHWGCLREIRSLHFELCYYAPLVWCLAEGAQRFEGGAQGEHKMARGLLPVATHSFHCLADDRFADAVRRFSVQEQAAVQVYEAELVARTPFR